MSTIIRCDGCQRELADIDDRVIVERDCSLSDPYVPELPRRGEPLHWCRDCAIVAVTALAGRAS
jgi:hypothetical protein